MLCGDLDGRGLWGRMDSCTCLAAPLLSSSKYGDAGDQACAVAHLYPTPCSPWTVAHQAPLPMEFSRQEHWAGVPFSTAGDLPDSGLKHASFVSPALAGRFFILAPPGELLIGCTAI